MLGSRFHIIYAFYHLSLQPPHEISTSLVLISEIKKLRPKVIKLLVQDHCFGGQDLNQSLSDTKTYTVTIKSSYLQYTQREGNRVQGQVGWAPISVDQKQSFPEAMRIGLPSS